MMQNCAESSAIQDSLFQHCANGFQIPSIFLVTFLLKTLKVKKVCLLEDFPPFLDRHQVWRSHDPTSIRILTFVKKLSYPLFLFCIFLLFASFLKRCNFFLFTQFSLSPWLSPQVIAQLIHLGYPPRLSTQVIRKVIHSVKVI